MSAPLDALRAIIEGLVGSRLDRLALYPARVVAQSADKLTLDLQPDDVRIPPCAGVPIRHGLPGVTVTVAAGERVLLGYAGGAPAQPYAALWEAGSVTSVSLNGGTAKAARVGHATSDGTLAFQASSTGAPPVSTLTVTYTPPGGAPQVVVITGLLGSATVAGPTSAHSLAGTITEGADALRLP
jgi:hypothetical protein